MYTLTIIIHVVVCFLMIAAILLQAGKGAEIGASFGGSSQTVFGSRGPGTFLSKVTVGAAVIFMLTSLSLAFLSKQANTSSTVIDLHSPAQSETSGDHSDGSHTESTPSTKPVDEKPLESSSDATPAPTTP
ncbi:MAG: preprotein translocase subunit SecG [Nitrospirales bacterium]|nr:preprotein translocase subunit SecG [Nitrospirales bacterium]